MKYKRGLFGWWLVLGLSLQPWVQAKEKKPMIQMAILLDTSGSMQGLIEQAKSQLWKVVNEFIGSSKNGRRPQIQVALYEYGKDSLPSESGYLRRIVPLTTDLDKVSEELFALTTNGGNEYCGQVIQSAVRELKWSSDKNDLKVIFIAGNEPFTQGSVDYRLACKESISRGIVINTIHCGSQHDGVAGNWKDAALLADGTYLNIDHNRRVQNITAPQDKKIAELGSKLNATYVSYGHMGQAAKKRQAVQDKNAASVSTSAMAERAVYKSSAAYSNTGWDLVDAYEKGSVKLKDLEDKELPDDMQTMDAGKREAHLKVLAEERRGIQKEINKLQKERKMYIEKKMKLQAKDGGNTLDQAMIDGIKKMAVKKGFRFEK